MAPVATAWTVCCPWRSRARREEPLLPHAHSRIDQFASPLAMGSRARSAVQRGDLLNPSQRARTDSETTASRKINALIAEGASVLNRGLGALRLPRIDPVQDGAWCTSGAILLILSGLITLPSVLSIEVYYFKLTGESFFKSDISSRSNGLAHLAGIPLACAAVNFLIQHIRRTTFWWESEVPRSCCGCDPLARWPMLLTVLGLVRSACLKLIDVGAAEHIAFYIELLISVLCLLMYYATLDLVHAIVKGMAQEQDLINKTRPVKKMQDLVRNITRSSRPEKDVVYCFAQTNTVPAEVLSYVWSLYYIIGKFLGAGITLAVFTGVDSNLISHFMIGGFALSAATASGFLFELGPNTLSLFRLSLNKPFYVGDLVTLNTNGAMDAPATSIMGFVENITMMYVVVRNFEMKQTWIPHKAFSAMIIQNWTRRPSKTVLLNIGVSCRCPVKKVQQLTSFGMRWIAASQEIQQANYRKCHITKVGNGYNIEVIFFPAVGVSHRGIRQKFLVAFMAAAERMQIPFVPLQIMQNFCEESAAAPPPDASAYVVDETQFDDLLPDPDDMLPKGVGLGFRRFPEDPSSMVGAAAAV